MIIVGAGGHAKEVLSVLLQSNYTEEILFFDDYNPNFKNLNGYSVINNIEDVKRTTQSHNQFILGMGDVQARKKFYALFNSIGLEHYSISAPSAIKSLHKTRVDYDVMNFCFIGPDARIGKGSLINTGSQIHHDVIIGEFCEISPKATILGKAEIGNYCRLGSNCTILPKVKIGDNVIIGAGAVITKDVQSNSVFVGVPGKFLKHLND